jgi:hypothetical protein
VLEPAGRFGEEINFLPVSDWSTILSDVDSAGTQLKLKFLATMNDQLREMLDIIHNF